MRIVTTYKTNANGRAQIVAKGNGKQKTVSYDHAQSMDWNHGTAAGALILANAVPAMTEWEISRERVDNATHETNESGTRHVFEV